MAPLETGIWGFLGSRKKFWLLPLVVVFVLFALLVIASVGSEANFTYTLE